MNMWNRLEELRNMQDVRRPLIPAKEAHQRFFPSLSRVRFYEAIRAKLIPHIRVGRSVLLSPDLVEAWIDGGGTPLEGRQKPE
jgi:excisionase family DNA binding protein